MSYQVLARKWRPRNFQELIGQEHVLKPLVNALTQQRLHHAYLFTGTRGVGKTTLGRILARCLNCETGITAEPCGTCSACEDINQGRFVDLIEVDAASRTKVEDTRELLDNVQYAPTRGRFKIYLIDEVHMLSNHSFNALLKTLEEPPPHIKFLLATTDPQRLPATILSRCLQFHLKNLAPEVIAQHLQTIATKENIVAEPSALIALAKAANGSVRDSLSLLDQAIAYCQAQLTLPAVQAMLGTIDQQFLVSLLAGLAQKDGQAILAIITQMAELNTDFSGALEALLSLIHQLAVYQVVPDFQLVQD
jgi:DNA polymerase-3 subunit gamma/tau